MEIRKKIRRGSTWSTAIAKTLGPQVERVRSFKRLGLYAKGLQRDE